MREEEKRRKEKKKERREGGSRRGKSRHELCVIASWYSQPPFNE